jgi:formylglycine-generating enzyme required for sulfatase activity
VRARRGGRPRGGVPATVAVPAGSFVMGSSAGRPDEAPPHEPRGPGEGVRRASRGGSWRHHVRWSPPSARSSLPPDLRYADYGFRVLWDVA